MVDGIPDWKGMAWSGNFRDDFLHVVNWRAMRRRRPFYLLSEKIWDGTAIPPSLTSCHFRLEGAAPWSPLVGSLCVSPVYAQPRTLGVFDFVFQDAPQCKGRISDGKPQKERTSPNAGGFAGV